VGKHWRKLDAGERGGTWRELCAGVSNLPDGILWRHNVAGDLPGDRDAIDPAALVSLVAANRGRDGYTYTHKPVLGDSPQARHNRVLIAMANEHGFAVNLSADSLDDADAKADLGIGPDDCRLCANRAASRCIIGFRAHGSKRKQITDSKVRLAVVQ
jgi:hypothetical protein